MEVEIEVDFILSVQFHCVESKQLIFMQRQRMKDLLLRVLKQRRRRRRRKRHFKINIWEMMTSL